MDKLLIITGPTATGKTDLSFSLAKKLNGELVAADSRQVYKKLDIGTGKMPSKKLEIIKGDKFWEIDGIRIWMYDLVDLQIQYTVADYIKEASIVIEDILKRGKLPIIVGGTGLYIKGLLEGFSNLNVPLDKELRGELEKLNLEQLQEKLKSLSPTKFNSLNSSDRKNLRRLLRSIELVSTNPYIKSSDKRQSISNKYDNLKIGLTAPREVLYKNSDLRILDWIKNGIMEEVKDIKILKRLGLEYGVIADFLEGKVRKEDLVEAMQNKLHRYIKRQLTWFKKQENIHWFNIVEEEYLKNVEKLVGTWYDSPDAKKN
jgi:tRNA dimethylallyltransferase